ncbi:MAG TPA: phosphatidate cytidylyltransferase [Candidatus Acidoferrales bacterium]|nr:phosphatidate cytidylyltransferase [Candidatus Acidoferrales bacterium]
MLRRILTAVVLIPIVVLLVMRGPWLLIAATAALVVLLAMNEFFDLGERMSLRAYRRWSMLSAVGIVFVQWMRGLEIHQSRSDVELIRNAAGPFISFEFVAIVFVCGVVAIGLASRGAIADILPSVAISAAGLLFVAFPLSYLVRIVEFEPNGRKFVLFTLVLVWAGDMLAYFVGQTFGHVRMAPILSPKKTWEGAAANLAAALVVATFFARWVAIDGVTIFAIAAAANIAGQAGDLIESAYKRGAGAKDSSSLLPGHGGMLDRIDSLIFAAPVVWWALVWLQHARLY